MINAMGDAQLVSMAVQMVGGSQPHLNNANPWSFLASDQRLSHQPFLSCCLFHTEKIRAFLPLDGPFLTD